jgi:flavin-dependent dehydrogenase
MYDVVVVGAGPAGVAAGKRCAEAGLSTLIIDKRTFPRRKACDGLMGPIAIELIEGEFGEIPSSVLADPPNITAIETTVYGIGSFQFEDNSPLLWRINLDHWLVQQLKAKGVELREGTQFVGLNRKNGHFRLRIDAGGQAEFIETRFVIGADGVVSRVRGAIFPELQFRILSQGLDIWEGEIDVSSDIYREFFNPEAGGLLGFSLQRKDGLITVSYVARQGNLAPVVGWCQTVLKKSYGLRIDGDPVWEGRCMSPDMGAELYSGSFLPAKGNVLLVGDSGGFMMWAGEGIGPGFKSGLLAAESIIAALGNGKTADQAYFAKLKPMLQTFGEACEVEKSIYDAAIGGGVGLFDHLKATRGGEFNFDY